MPVLDTERLRYEMDTRGLLGGDLARMARIDANTVSRALAGRPVAIRTVRSIAGALLAQPPFRMGAELIAKPARAEPGLSTG